MKIGVDLDGCVYDFTQEALEECAEYLRVDPSSLQPAETWDFYKVWGLTSAVFWGTIVPNAVEAGRMWCRGKPMDGAVEALQALRDDGHTIHIVTNREPYEVETVKWLKESDVPFDSITITTDKTIVAGVDFIIDDYEGNYHALVDAGIPHVVLMDQPWNRHVDAAVRVTSWEQFVSYVRSWT